jgi:GT2 family glycosyltransferase
MSFHLVLTAFDRKVEVERFFTSLANQTLSDRITVEFINQGSSPIPDQRLPKNILLNEKVINRRIPLSNARNMALSNINNDIVGFPDDDCWYEPRVLESVKRYFDSNPEIDCVCTAVFDPNLDKSYGRRPLDIVLPIKFSNIFYLPSSVGIFVRLPALRKAGAFFDLRLGAGTILGSGEETDLVARLLESGSSVIYLGNIKVYHPVVDYKIEDAKKFYHYGLGFGYLNMQFLKKGHFAVMPFYFNILLRSLIGFFVFIHKPIKRQVYWQRLLGMIKGGLQGIFSPVGNRRNV